MEWVIDADAHVTESAGVWQDRVPKKYRELAPRLQREDGEDYWYMNGVRLTNSVGATAVAGWEKQFPRRPRNLDEVPPGAVDPKARLLYMDSVGIWAQVLYPNVAGFGNAQFLKYDDAELRLACVRAYNDWLIEWCSADPRRLLPVLATPFWDVEATVDEIERSASLGHRGILFTGEPQRFGMPPFGDPYWHPFWSTVQETGLPVSFHIGSGDLDLVQQAANKSYDGNIGRYGVKSTLDLYLNNAIQVVDLVLSGVLARYPGVRVVSVESGIGWVPFVLEALDHAAKSFKLATYAPEFEMPPSEYLRRQVSVCYFFEEFAPRHLVDAIGADNILFETDYPHPTCLYGNVRETIEAGLSDQPQEVRSKLLWGNSARLYHVDDPVVAKV